MEISPFNLQEQQLTNEYLQYADEMLAVRKNLLGYPANEDSGMSGFYNWYIQSGLADSLMNNAGDCYAPSHFDLSSHRYECKVIDYFADLLQFAEDYWGLIGTGGTDGNNHGVYFGKKILWERTGELPIVYTSAEAHYSNMRLADLQGLQVKRIPADAEGRMDVASFAKALAPNKPALVIYAIGTTFKGAMDDVAALEEIIRQKSVKNIYRHFDAALFGGYLPFTRCKDLVSQKLWHYDSLAISGHKFFGIDEPCCVFVCRKEVFDAQQNSNIPYLESSMPMISCSRSALTPLKMYWLLKTKGWYYYARLALVCIKNAEYLHKELLKLKWPAWRNNASNIVYFKRPAEEIMHKYSLAKDCDKRLGGNLAHIVVMPHVKQPLLERFLKDLAKEIVGQER